jgi:hypothetical protein
VGGLSRRHRGDPTDHVLEAGRRELLALTDVGVDRRLQVIAVAGDPQHQPSSERARRAAAVAVLLNDLLATIERHVRLPEIDIPTYPMTGLVRSQLIEARPALCAGNGASGPSRSNTLFARSER